MSAENAKKLINQIIESGNVTPDQIRDLDSELNSDWVVNQEEIDLLFQLNNSLGGKDENCPEWTEFFVRNVTRLVVMDMYTPGEIDGDEGNWLGGVFEKYRVHNDTETKLVDEIKKTTTSIQGKFQSLIQAK